MLALIGDYAERYRALGAILHATQATDAVTSENGLAAAEVDILLQAESLALTAADTLIGNGKLCALEACDGGPTSALDHVDELFGRIFRSALCLDILRYLL